MTSIRYTPALSNTTTTGKIIFQYFVVESMTYLEFPFLTSADYIPELSASLDLSKLASAPQISQGCTHEHDGLSMFTRGVLAGSARFCPQNMMETPLIEPACEAEDSAPHATLVTSTQT